MAQMKSTQSFAAIERQCPRRDFRRPGGDPWRVGEPRPTAKTQTMHRLRWADFVPASDALRQSLRDHDAMRKDLGMKLTVETINANDIQARITAAIQSGSGPDIFMTLNNWPQLYADSCSDVSDVAEDLGKAQGGFYNICEVVGTVGGKWIGVPWCTGGGLVAYRKSWFCRCRGEGIPEDVDDYLPSARS